MTFDNNEYQKEWRKNNPKKIKKYRINYRKTEKGKLIMKKENKKYRDRLRLFAISIYSDNTMKCADCGYDDIDALDIDHINNDGNVGEKKYNHGTLFHNWLKQNSYPDGFQVLCKNCNWIKHLKHYDSMRGY